MRVLHVTDHYPPVMGGIESHVCELSEQQSRRGHDVSVLTSTPRRADGRISTDVGPTRVWRAGSLLEGLRFDIGGYDLVHAHLSVVAPFSGPLTGVFARRGVPTVVTVHSLWNGMGPVPRWGAELSRLRRAPVTWTAVSPVAAEQVRVRLPAHLQVGVLPNAVSTRPRDTTPVHDGRLRLVSTMRLAARKRPLELLRVVEALRREVPVQLTLVGDGPLRPKVEQLVRRLGLSSAVQITGRVEPAVVRERLADSDVYVAPAVLESFGLAALEARCVGLPVVGRARTGLTGFVRDGIEGFLGDTDADLLGALRDLAVDHDLRHWISEHNRTVPSEMTWTRALDAHDEVYAAALGDVVVRQR